MTRHLRLNRLIVFLFTELRLVGLDRFHVASTITRSDFIAVNSLHGFHPTASSLLSSSYLDFAALKSIRFKSGELRRALLIVIVLLLANDVEPNPGPSGLRFGSLNVQSAVRKAALIHDLIADRNLDVLALSETWIVDCD